MQRLRKKVFLLFLVTGLVYIGLVSRSIHVTKNRRENCGKHSCLSEIQKPPGQYFLETDNNDVITDVAFPDIVIYNRLPKCASTTTRKLISALKRDNDFNLEIHSWPLVKQRLTNDEEEALVHQIAHLQQPVLFLRHLHFVDFQKFNVTQPGYINMVRDPVDRFISHYYFARFGFVGWSETMIKKWLLPMSDKKRNMSIEDCVSKDANECVGENYENFLQFFCGQDPRCINDADWALEKAKDNVRRYYVVIGILEEFETSLKVFENILPRYFKGASKMHKSLNHDVRHYRTANKVNPSLAVRTALSSALWREMELYRFMKNRFDTQVRALKDAGKIT